MLRTPQPGPATAGVALLICGLAPGAARGDVAYSLGRSLILESRAAGGSSFDSLFSPDQSGPWDAELELIHEHTPGAPPSTARGEHHSLLEDWGIRFAGNTGSVMTTRDGVVQAQNILLGTFVYTGPDAECTLDIAAIISKGDFHARLVRIDDPQVTIFDFSLRDGFSGSYATTGLITAGTYDIRLFATTFVATPGPGTGLTTFDARLTIPSPGPLAAALLVPVCLARRRR